MDLRLASLFCSHTVLALGVLWSPCDWEDFYVVLEGQCFQLLWLSDMHLNFLWRSYIFSTGHSFLIFFIAHIPPCPKNLFKNPAATRGVSSSFLMNWHFWSSKSLRFPFINKNLDISDFPISELEVCKLPSFSVACDARIHNCKYLNQVQFIKVILSLNQGQQNVESLWKMKVHINLL